MEFDIRKYVRLLLKWWWLLVIGAIIPVIVSFYFTSQETALYQARVILMVGTTLQSSNPDAGEIGIAERLARGYAEIVRYRPVTNEVIRKLGLKLTPERLASQIVAFVRPEANLLEIWVTDENPRAAALIANALADELIRQSPASQMQGEQQRFIEQQLSDLKVKIEEVEKEIDEATSSLVNLTSAAEIQAAQEYIASQETIASRYHSQYMDYLESFTGSSVNQLAIVEPAVEPEYPMGSKRMLVLAVAGAAGLALGLGAVFAIEYLDNTVRWEGDQNEKLSGIPVLGALARMPNSKGALIARSTERSPEAEAIRTLRTSLFLSRRRTHYRSVLITSSGNGEGKSFVTANLAVSMAAAGLKTVLVDGDMRRPTQHVIFDLPNFFGLANLLDRSTPAEDVDSLKGLQTTEVSNLFLLSAGKIPLDPAIFLTSPTLALLMRALQEHADIVLVDSPPVLSAPDTALLASECGATLLVVNNGVTSRTGVDKAKAELLQYEGINLVGTAFNNVKLRGGPYDYRDLSKRRSLLSKLWSRLPVLGVDGFDDNGHLFDDPDRILDLGEIAAYLGVQRHTARRWCQSARIPAFKKRWRWYARYGDLQAMVLRQLSGERDDKESVALPAPTLPSLESRN